MIPRLHRGPLSMASWLMDDYHRLVSNLPMAHSHMFSPSFDIRETENAYLLEGELPGVQQKDLDIEFEDSHCLHIKGKNERESSSNEGSWWVSERSVGEFSRSFNFPSAIDEEKAEAKLKNGVLSLTVPKSASAKNTKKVPVQIQA